MLGHEMIRAREAQPSRKGLAVIGIRRKDAHRAVCVEAQRRLDPTQETRSSGRELSESPAGIRPAAARARRAAPRSRRPQAAVRPARGAAGAAWTRNSMSASPPAPALNAAPGGPAPSSFSMRARMARISSICASDGGAAVEQAVPPGAEGRGQRGRARHHARPDERLPFPDLPAAPGHVVGVERRDRGRVAGRNARGGAGAGPARRRARGARCPRGPRGPPRRRPRLRPRRPSSATNRRSRSEPNASSPPPYLPSATTRTPESAGQLPKHRVRELRHRGLDLLRREVPRIPPMAWRTCSARTKSQSQSWNPGAPARAPRCRRPGPGRPCA